MVRAPAVDASPALLDAVRRRSDGNPLFVEELVRTLHGGSDEVPPTIQEAIRRRVARLPADAQTLLSIAPVVGKRFELEAGSADRRARQAAALAAARAAPELELVREERLGGFRFRHALTRDAVYGRLLVSNAGGCTRAWPRRSPSMSGSARLRLRSTTRPTASATPPSRASW